MSGNSALLQGLLKDHNALEKKLLLWDGTGMWGNVCKLYHSFQNKNTNERGKF